MGTSNFAACSLNSLYESGHDICGVFTRADKPSGRKMNLTQSPVKQLALELGLKVFQPATLRNSESLELVSGLEPELIAVVAYGMLLPRTVLDIPPFGCVNVHGSILPRHRGASPINATIISGDELAGVTTMYMAEELDAGDIIQIAKTPVGPGETAGELYERLKVLGAELLCETIGLISENKAPGIPQNDHEATYCGKLTKESGLIDWSRPAVNLSNLIRGLNPKPGAYTFFEGKKLKIHMGLAANKSATLEPGSIEAADKSQIEVSCGQGSVLAVTSLQLEGKKTVSAAEFLNGYKLKRGDRLG
jgi:methionyl-tRNA formyltransferase